MPVRSRSRARDRPGICAQSASIVAQLVELGVVALGDHAAVAHLRGRLRRRWRARAVPAIADRQSRSPRERRDERGVERRDRLRASSGSSASVSRRPARSRGRALRARCARRCARCRRCGAVARRARGRVAGSPRSASTASCRARRRTCERSGCSSQWRSSRLPAALAHSSSSDSSVGAGSPAQRLRDLEVAPRRGVERDELAGRFDVQRADVGERGLLRRARVLDQRAGGAHAPAARSATPKPARSSVPKLPRQRALAAAPRRIAMRAAHASAGRARASAGAAVSSGSSNSAASSALERRRHLARRARRSA